MFRILILLKIIFLANISIANADQNSELFHITNESGLGRVNCSANIFDYMDTIYNCEFFDEIEIRNISRNKLNNVWISIIGDDFSVNPEYYIKSIFENKTLSEVDKTKITQIYISALMQHGVLQNYKNYNFGTGLVTYGFGLCTDLGSVLSDAVKKYGNLSTRWSNMYDHDAIEVFTDGQWRLFDVDTRVWLTDKKYNLLSSNIFMSSKDKDKIYPKFYQRYGSNRKDHKDILLKHYVSTNDVPIEGTPLQPYSGLHPKYPTIDIPPYSSITFIYGNTGKNADTKLLPSSGVMRTKFSLEGEAYSQVEKLLNIESHLIDKSFKSGLKLLDSTVGIYTYEGDFPITSVNVEFEGKGVCSNIDGKQRFSSITKKHSKCADDTLVKYSYKRDLYKPTYSVSVPIWFEPGAVLTKLKIEIDQHINKTIMPRPTSSKNVDLKVNYSGEEKAIEMNYKLNENYPSIYIMNPKISKIAKEDGYSIHFEKSGNLTDWIVVDRNGIPVHSNLYGFSKPNDIMKIPLFYNDNYKVVFRFRDKHSGLYSNYTKPLDLESCNKYCPNIEFYEENKIFFD